MQPTTPVYGAIILGAGQSRRMGWPKLLLPWGGVTVLEHLIRQWQELGAAQIAFVISSDDQIVQELDRLGVAPENRIPNPNPERGMFSSIVCAATWTKWNADLTHWIAILGDQPHLHTDTLRALLDFSASRQDSICQPLHREHRKHPVILPRRIFEALKDTKASTLKDFLKEHQEQLAGFESDDAGLALDLDTPADYQRAREIYFGATGDGCA